MLDIIITKSTVLVKEKSHNARKFFVVIII